MDGKLRNMTGVYITDHEKMLLLYRIGSKVVQPSWCSVGGHFESFELNDPKSCALREVYEETGIQESDLAGLRLKYIALRSKNDEIRQNYYFFADLINQDLQLKHSDEGILEWVSIDKVLERDMPYTAKEVLRHYLSIGRYDNKLYAGIATEKQTIFHELTEF